MMEDTEGLEWFIPDPHSIGDVAGELVEYIDAQDFGDATNRLYVSAGGARHIQAGEQHWATFPMSIHFEADSGDVLVEEYVVTIRPKGGAT